MYIRWFAAMTLLLLMMNGLILGEANENLCVRQSKTEYSNHIYWVGVEYTFNFTYVDPDGDSWHLFIDWGDGTISDWIGPFSSGSTISFTHYWTKPGAYEIKTKVKDIHGQQSDWSIFEITVVPPNRLFLDMEITGNLKTGPYDGFIFKLFNFDTAVVHKMISNDGPQTPFTCHNYHFLMIFARSNQYDIKTMDIMVSSLLTILIRY